MKSLLGWKHQICEVDEIVKVYDLDKVCLGLGKMRFKYDVLDEDNPMPEIVMIGSGEIILGCDCWWIPLKEVITIHQEL